MRKIIIIIISALLGLVGASAQSSINIFIASGGARTISYNIPFTGIQDSSYIITTYYMVGSGGTAWAMKNYMVKATGVKQTIVDTITDNNSANTLITSDTICVVARLKSVGIIDTLSNTICGISVTDIPKIPKITAVLAPYVTANGSGYLDANVETNASAIVSTWVSLDSVGTYLSINKLADISIMANPNQPKITEPLGTCPTGRCLWVRSEIVNSAGKNSIGPLKTNVYFPPVPATCEIDSVAPYSNKFGVRVKIVGAGLPTDGMVEVQKVGTSTWYNLSDTFHVSGVGVQPSWVNTHPILQPETAYFIRSWVYNGLGTKSYSYVSPQPYYTNKVDNLGYLTISINKVIEDTHGGIDATFTTTTANNTTAAAYVKCSQSRNFTPSIIKGPFTVNTSSDTRTEHLLLSTPGTYFITGSVMDSKGVQIDSSNVLTVTVHNWALGIDPNGQYITSEMDGATFKLYDINGKLLKDELINANERINLSDFIKGTYIYTICLDSQIKTGKITKF